MTMLLIESSSLRGRLDTDRGILRGVKIIGLTSRHGYAYLPAALKAAAPLYEGVRVNIDHPNRKTPGETRSYRDRFGSLRNIRFVEGAGLFGDFHYNKTHEVAAQFEWDAEHNPGACGFSHNARGELVNRGGKLVCESIEGVRSVDLVADPATTDSLFEGGGEWERTAAPRSWAQGIVEGIRPVDRADVQAWVQGLLD